MTEHTPGPWVMRTWGSTSCVMTEGNDTIAINIENEADARLIAAAPEMLELLRECCQGFLLPHGVSLADDVDAFLAKIDGK